MNQYRTKEEIENESDDDIIYYHKFVSFNDIDDHFLQREFKTTKDQIKKELKINSLQSLSLVVYEETFDSEKLKSDFNLDCVYFKNKKAISSSVFDYFRTAKIYDRFIFNSSDLNHISELIKVSQKSTSSKNITKSVNDKIIMRASFVLIKNDTCKEITKIIHHSYLTLNEYNDFILDCIKRAQNEFNLKNCNFLEQVDNSDEQNNLSTVFDI